MPWQEQQATGSSLIADRKLSDIIVPFDGGLADASLRSIPRRRMAMTRERRRWVVRTIRETGKFYGQLYGWQSGGALRRCCPGVPFLGRTVACQLVLEMLDDGGDLDRLYEVVASTMKMAGGQVEDLVGRLLPVLLEEIPTLENELAEIRFNVDAAERGLACATF